MPKQKIYKTDWLASDPIFYNTKNKKISRNVNDIIDYQDLKFHPEGLANYLAWGYSVFGQTPIRNIKFLLPNQSISISSSGKLVLVEHEDPVLSWENKKTTSEGVLSLIQDKIKSWEQSQTSPIILPLSGGYDSRLLASMLTNKSHIQSYTYGPTGRQNDSFEVKYAEEVSGKLDINWQHITLNNYHNLISGWYQLYGISTHAHGMYQLDFYQSISKLNKNGAVLSGIIGDAWSGKSVHRSINSSTDLISLGYSHGIHADPSASRLKYTSTLQDNYFHKNKSFINSPNGSVITSMRMKMILLSYLIRVPESLGHSVYGPFLDAEVVSAILNLPKDQLENRRWQTEYFHNLDLLPEESYHKPVNMSNTINQDMINQHPPPPLDVTILAEIINPKYIDWINNNLNPKILNKLATWSLTTRYLGYLANKLHIPNLQLKAYSAYLTLMPMQTLIKKRNAT